MSFPKYPAYKNSTIKWLDEIPQHWSEGRLKDLVSIRSGQDYRHVETDDAAGVPVIGSGGAFAYANTYLLNGESVLLGRKGTIDKPLYVNGPFWTVDTMFYTEVMRWAFAKFVYYLATTIPFSYYSTSTALPSMSQSDLGNHTIAVPEFLEQIDIARFLDFETSRIDALISEQQRLIELLKEKRQAAITHAVTKGLDPSVPLKDSGVEGLGQVPSHWIVARLKYFFDSLDFMRIPLKAEERGSRTGEYPYFGASGIIDYIDDYIFSEELVLVSEDGANLLLRSTPIAFVARGKYWVNNHAHILRPMDGLVGYWAEVIDQMDVRVSVTGSAQPKLTAEALGSLMVATPPDPAEREVIHSYIADFDARTGYLVREATSAIELLQERRSALISAAVTGKIDVRGWQPPSTDSPRELAGAVVHG